MTGSVARLVIFWVAAIAAIAAEPATTVKDLAFLAGRWGGMVAGFQADEIWSSAANGSLMGVYREMKDGKTTFFEFLTIEQEDGGLMLRLRHFKPGMKSLDTDPVVFALARFSRGKAVFENGNQSQPVRMTFERKGPDQLEVLLEHKRENGEWTHELFAYTRHEDHDADH
jgi:hypothetical protein